MLFVYIKILRYLGDNFLKNWNIKRIWKKLFEKVDCEILSIIKKNKTRQQKQQQKFRYFFFNTFHFHSDRIFFIWLLLYCQNIFDFWLCIRMWKILTMIFFFECYSKSLMTQNVYKNDITFNLAFLVKIIFILLVTSLFHHEIFFFCRSEHQIK